MKFDLRIAKINDFIESLDAETQAALEIAEIYKQFSKGEYLLQQGEFAAIVFLSKKPMNFLPSAPKRVWFSSARI